MNQNLAMPFSLFERLQMPEGRRTSGFLLALIALTPILAFLVAYDMQTTLAASANGLADYTPSMARAPVNAMLVGLAISVVLIAAWGIQQAAHTQRLRHRYAAYLSQKNVFYLKIQAQAAETDAITRQALVAHLTSIEPGWSYRTA